MPLGIGSEAVEEALGRSGKVNGGFMQFGVRGRERAEEGMVVRFMGIGNGNQYSSRLEERRLPITGRLRAAGEGSNPVMKALARDNGSRSRRCIATC